MTLKELCEKSGLSKKTIRFYEEKGLIAPKTEYRNGRNYRDYTPQELALLIQIATLRKAWFTIDEIRRMQEDPAAIREIFPQYHLWLRQQKQDIDNLLLAAEQVDPASLSDIGSLAEALSAAAAPMPLPENDLRPRFRYLDELEEPRKTASTADHTDRVLSGDKIHRQITVLTSKDKQDDSLLKVNIMNETADLLKHRESAPVADREPEKEPLWLRLISGILTLCLGAAVIWVLASFFTFTPNPTAWALFAIFLLLRGGLQFIKYRREQNAWLRRMGQTHTERGWAALEDQTKKVIIGCVCGIVVLAVAVGAYTLFLKDNTVSDCRIAIVYHEDMEGQFPQQAKERVESAFGYLIGDRNGDGVVQIDIRVITPDRYDGDKYDVVLAGSLAGNRHLALGLAEPPQEYTEGDSLYIDLNDAPFLRDSGYPDHCYAGVSPELSPEEQADFFDRLHAMKTLSIPWRYLEKWGLG